SGLVRAGFDFGLSAARQISLVDYPGGTVHRVTRDGNDYFHVSASGGDLTLAAVRQVVRADLWLLDPGGTDPTPVPTFASAESPPIASDFCDDGSIVFAATRDDAVRLWSVSPGSEPKPLTDAGALSTNPRCVPGGVLYDRYDQDGAVHVWRVNA